MVSTALRNSQANRKSQAQKPIAKSQRRSADHGAVRALDAGDAING
ncbi:MAG: hypothetical protein GWP70_02795 [Proteobacteria bacterium]|nr:hypothetical protein [Pseudomonadota bacterium]